MIQIILIIIILFVIYKIIETYSSSTNFTKSERFINITNPFKDGVDQNDFANQDKLVNDIPVNGYTNNKNILNNKNSSNNKNILNNKNRLAIDIYKHKQNKINNDIYFEYNVLEYKHLQNQVTKFVRYKIHQDYFVLVLIVNCCFRFFESNKSTDCEVALLPLHKV